MPAQPAIILAKHQSAWETVAFLCLFPPVSPVIKQELLKVPFFGWAFRMLSPIAIDRGAGREALKQIVAQGQEKLAQGFWVLVFPEGEYTPDGRVMPFRTGIGLLALNLNLPVVPLRIEGLFELKQARKKVARPGTVKVTLGAPVRFPPDTDPAAIARVLEERVRALGAKETSSQGPTERF